METEHAASASLVRLVHEAAAAAPRISRCIALMTANTRVRREGAETMLSKGLDIALVSLLQRVDLFLTFA
jgi:hypothetical protein